MGLSDNNSYKYEVIGEKHIRISLWHTVAYTLKNVAAGDRIAMRYGLYYMPPFVFSACNICAYGHANADVYYAFVVHIFQNI